jgi:hypothetical protein
LFRLSSSREEEEEEEKKKTETNKQKQTTIKVRKIKSTTKTLGGSCFSQV